MPKVGFIDSEFWFNPNVRTVTKLIVVYCYTSVHTTPLGCFRLPLAYVAADLQLPEESIKAGFAHAERAGLLCFDEDTEWLWIPAFLQWNKAANLSQWKIIRALLCKVPREVQFYQALIQSLLIQVSRCPCTQCKTYHAVLTTQTTNQARPRVAKNATKALTQRHQMGQLIPFNPNLENNDATTLSH